MKFTCPICNKNISKERIAALKMLNLPTNQWACVKCSQIRKKAGVYMGEPGTSELLIVDEVRDDSVRSVFGMEDVVTEREEV